MKKLLRISALTALLVFGSLGIGNVNAHTWVVQREEIMDDGQICTTIGILCAGGGGTNLNTCGSLADILRDLEVTTAETCGGT